MESPVHFRTAPGAAPPGQPVEELPLRSEKELHHGFDGELVEKRTRQHLPSIGPGLPLEEAEAFLRAEGVKPPRIDELLQRFRREGAVPQAYLAELLDELPGMPGDAPDEG
mmetsp:Transcript_62987/g.130619  ORF Transcript_62987/g.130619 Transcript_62987/m.130619 type:complete len:111 (+) Transcript_62987:70-402(+)